MQGDGESSLLRNRPAALKQTSWSLSISRIINSDETLAPRENALAWLKLQYVALAERLSSWSPKTSSNVTVLTIGWALWPGCGKTQPRLQQWTQQCSPARAPPRASNSNANWFYTGRGGVTVVGIMAWQKALTGGSNIAILLGNYGPSFKSTALTHHTDHPGKQTFADGWDGASCLGFLSRSSGPPIPLVILYCFLYGARGPRKGAKPLLKIAREPSRGVKCHTWRRLW